MQSRRLAGILLLTGFTAVSGYGENARTLKGIPVPQPSAAELAKYVSNKPLATAVGKALFWDMQVGSDGVVSCATCHFHAGADNRSFNQVNPFTASSVTKVFSMVPGPNQQLSAANFPVRTSNVVSSQGICLADFKGIAPGSAIDNSTPRLDPLFNIGGRNVRRAEPRNTPSSVGAVFNHRNFWDGRAKNIFNGVTPFGDQDPAARVAMLVNGSLQAVRISIPDSSLASQAVGPPLSELEMSFAGRTFPDVGRKMLNLPVLAKQKVSTGDSMLGAYANASGNGAWAGKTYADLIRSTFDPKWWNSTQIVVVNPDRSISFRSAPTGAANEYTQMEYNFSLFFGLAVQLYEAALVPDDSPFDRWDAGQGQLSSFELAGKAVFEGKGKCINCHGGPEFTNASVRKAGARPIERMIMGNNQPAVYDTGFYNIAVRPTQEDIGVGGTDPWNNPLSFSKLFQQATTLPFVPGDPANLAGTLSRTERTAVNGAHKTPTVRNAALTAPYFWNGGHLTLRDVISFYNRGADFRNNNLADLDADIQPLGLSEFEEEALLAFMNALTDGRVQRHAAPFDHPSLDIPLGGAGCATAPPAGGQERFIDLPAVGADGYTTPPAVIADFLGINQNDANPNQFNVANPVDLNGQFNVNAIVNRGTSPQNGGLDGFGKSYNANELGATLSWGGLNFVFGTPNQPNGITSKTVIVTPGLYSRVKLLGTAVNGTQTNQTIRINYTDGSTTSVQQSFSDWASLNPLLLRESSFPNQGHAKTMPTRVGLFGLTDSNGLLVNYNWLLSGYDIAVDPTKAVESITLPNNRNVVILAVNMAPAAPVPVDPQINHALGRAATQSSLFNANGGPEKAVDGNFDGNFNGGGSVTHTNLQSQPFWQVDLGASRAISQVKVWNRTDCCADRLANYWVLISDTPFSSTSLSAVRAQAGVTAIQFQGAMTGESAGFNVARNGRYVRIQLEGINYLSLTEVEVFGPRTIAPTVSLTSPVAGTSFSAPAAMTLTADAAGSIAKVEFFNGATKLGEDLTAPYSFAWNGVAAGSYSITVRATSTTGTIVNSAAVNVTVTAPAPTNQPPTVSITSPTAGASFTAPASVTINATAADADGTIAKVEFFNGTTKLGEDLSSPYSFAWTGVAAGTYPVTVVATDNAGAATTSAAVSVTVTAAGNASPTVSITSPTGGASFTAPASVTINATATDAGGSVTKVEFFNGATKLGEDLSAPYSFTWTSVAAGSYTLTARATDNLGAATTSAAVTISVNAPGNSAPTVSITSPTAGASFSAPASVTINATAADSDGTITKVEFFNGATKLGEDLTAPYSFTWTNVAAANYTITARATDNGGATTTSSVNIVVNATGGACAFPAISAITDNFNRANGAVGGSWAGAIGGYSVSNNLLVAGDGDQYMVWNQAFGPAMEVSVKLTNINTAASEIDLLLKSVSQSWNSGVVLVSYIPSAGQLQVWSSANGNWTQHNAINVTLAAGDTIGGRLKADGSVEVYRNGTLLGSTSVSSWPYVNATGFGGMWVVGGAGTSFDDFRAGTLTCQ